MHGSWGPFLEFMLFLMLLAVLGAFATVAVPSYIAYRVFGRKPASIMFLFLVVSMWAGFTWLESRKKNQPDPFNPVHDPVVEIEERLIYFFVIAGAATIVATPVYFLCFSH